MNLKKKLQKLRVPMGFICGVGYFIFARPNTLALVLGGPLVLLGIAFRFWASGHIHKNKEVTQGGPYALTRNPLYFGSFLMGLGFSVQSGFFWLPPTFAVLFFLVYIPVIRQEEIDLTRLFGDAYPAYMKRVSCFFPRPGLPMGRFSFSWAQAMKNREYNAPLGCLFAEIVLFAKWLGYF